MATVSEKLVEIIAEAGIDHVFILPGGEMCRLLGPLYDRRDAIKAILVRNEQTASCMAEMYGRLTGRPGVIIGQGPFVGSAGLFGMMEGYLTSAPMVAVTDLTEYGGFALHAPFQCGTGDYGGLDLKGIFQATTKFVTVATSPVEAIHGLQLAIKHSLAGRPGPAACLCRSTALQGELTDETLARVFPVTQYLRVARPAASPEDVEEAVNLLAGAERPVIIAGNGIHAGKAYGELLQLAELGGFPVATSYQGKSAIPEVHPLAVGVMNMYGEKLALKAVSQADVVLVIGCRLKPQDTCFESPELINPRRQKLIQVDIDPRNAGWVFPVELGLTGDAQVVMRQLIEGLRERNKGGRIKHPAGWTKTISDWKKTEGYYNDPSFDSSQVPIQTIRVVKEFRDHLPADTIFTLDGGNNRICMLRYFSTRQAGTCFAAAGIGAMSLSVPAAITAKLLHPERPCVAVCGDGGMAMQIHALSTAKQYRAAAIFVVMNDSVLGAVRDLQTSGRVVASEFIGTDFVRIAEAFDCGGIRVEKPDEIAPALEKALVSQVPFVIDIATDPDERIRSKAMSPWAQKSLAALSSASHPYRPRV